MYLILDLPVLSFDSPVNIPDDAILHIFLLIYDQLVSPFSHNFENILRKHTIFKPGVHLAYFNPMPMFLLLFLESFNKFIGLFPLCLLFNSLMLLLCHNMFL